MTPDFALLSLGLLAAALVTFPFLHQLGLFWPSRRAAFVKFADAQGMKVQSEGDFASAEARLPGGGKLNLELRFVDGSRRYYQLNATITLKGCPKGLTVRAESLWTGFRRLVGSRPERFGDQELDAAFWVECPNLEDLRSYLTPIRRRGLLEVMAYLPGCWIQNGRLRVEKSFFLPWGDLRRLQEVFQHCTELDDAFNAQGKELAKEHERRGHIQAIRIRQSWPVSGLLLLWLLGLGAMTEDLVGQVLVTLSLLGLLLLVLALTGVGLGRTLLQGYFAFASLSLVAYVLAGFGGVFETPDVESPVLFYLVVLVSAAFTWAMRHFLKELVASPHSQNSMEF